MFPEALQIGPVSLHTYGIMVALGILCGVVLIVPEVLVVAVAVGSPVCGATLGGNTLFEVGRHLDARTRAVRQATGLRIDATEDDSRWRFEFDVPAHTHPTAHQSSPHG